MKKIFCIAISLIMVMTSSISIAYAKPNNSNRNDEMKYWQNMLKQYYKEKKENKSNNKKTQNNKEQDKKTQEKKKQEKKTYIKQIVNIKRQNNIRRNFIFLNGEEVETDVAPVIKEGRVLVPVRAIVQGLGARVEWNEATDTVTITKGGTVIKIKLGSDIVYVNGKACRIDVPARSDNNRVVVPVRFIAERFNQKVEWDEETGSVIIEDEDEDDDEDEDEDEDDDNDNEDDEDDDSSNLAKNKAVKASSEYSSTYSAKKAVDGNTSTRWLSKYGDDTEWIYVDLGSRKSISKIKLAWGTDYAEEYKLFKSNDASKWTQIYSTTSGNGGTDTIAFSSESARYIKVYAYERATNKGYSLHEFEVYGATTDEGNLTGTLASPSYSVNLSSEGTKDWSHWGYEDGDSFNHKNGVTQQISDYTKIGDSDVDWLDDNPVLFTWTGGTPDKTVYDTDTGIYVTEEGNGFQIKLPADTTQRRLNLYVGAWEAKGKLTASLSDGSAPAYTTYVDADSNNVCRVISLNFKAGSSGEKLTVKYIIDEAYDSDDGYITLQAATLR